MKTNLKQHPKNHPQYLVFLIKYNDPPVLKAALKSNKIKTAQLPETTDSKRSFTTLKKADSILCLTLKPD